VQPCITVSIAVNPVGRAVIMYDNTFKPDIILSHLANLRGFLELLGSICSIFLPSTQYQLTKLDRKNNLSVIYTLFLWSRWVIFRITAVIEVQPCITVSIAVNPVGRAVLMYDNTFKPDIILFVIVNVILCLTSLSVSICWFWQYHSAWSKEKSVNYR
jgi:hypothetical protein